MVTLIVNVFKNNTGSHLFTWIDMMFLMD